MHEAGIMIPRDQSGNKFRTTAMLMVPTHQTNRTESISWHKFPKTFQIPNYQSRNSACYYLTFDLNECAVKPGHHLVLIAGLVYV